MELARKVKGRKVVVPVNGHHRQVTLGEFVKVSLGTKEPKIAKELYRETAAAVEDLWQQLRQEAASGPVRLTSKQVVALSGQYYNQLVQTYEDDPGDSEGWDLSADALEFLGSAGREREHGETANALLHKAGLVIDTESRKRLLQAMNQAAMEAARCLYRRANGDYSPDPNAIRFPELHPPAPAAKAAEGVTISDLFDLWKADHLLAGGPEKTVRDFRQKLDSLTDFLGHEDAQRITPKQIVDWTDYLLHEKDLSSKTVGEKYLATVKRVFTVGKRKFRITDNPAADVTPKHTHDQHPGLGRSV